jgi:CheY-like chemotaxis protein
VGSAESKEDSMRLADSMQTTAPESPSLRILVADDNALLRTAVRGLLMQLGHIVEVAANGREAVESAANSAFDIIFLDVQMPEMGGIEAAHLLRRSRGEGLSPRIFGISGGRADDPSYVESGMEALLPKPVRLADLVRAIGPP